MLIIHMCIFYLKKITYNILKRLTFSSLENSLIILSAMNSARSEVTLQCNIDILSLVFMIIISVILYFHTQNIVTS